MLRKEHRCRQSHQPSARNKNRGVEIRCCHLISSRGGASYGQSIFASRQLYLPGVLASEETCYVSTTCLRAMLALNLFLRFSFATAGLSPPLTSERRC